MPIGRLLSISPVVPSDTIGHAGGKTYNFYIKRLSSAMDVSAFLFCPINEQEKCDLSEYNIGHKLVFTSGTFLVNLCHAVMDTIGLLLYRNKMRSLYKYMKIVQYLNKLKKHNSLPEIIELEWTNFVYYAAQLRKKFPAIQIIASEHDVTFQSLSRKNIKTNHLSILKKQELDALNCCDSILVQSEKDKNLLLAEGIPNSKIVVISPYYHDMRGLNRNPNKKDILFWGAMYRPENYEAAIWFIQHVMPILDDLDVRFIVAGNRPPEVLKKMASDRVVVTGFIEDETPLFETGMCFVSPLLTGAGIKVKVIEALSAGIPVLTNEIGIEGIPAIDKKEYFHCESAEDFAGAIRKIQNGEINEQELLENQMRFMENNFNMEASLRDYTEMIMSL